MVVDTSLPVCGSVAFEFEPTGTVAHTSGEQHDADGGGARFTSMLADSVSRCSQVGSQAAKSRQAGKQSSEVEPACSEWRGCFMSAESLSLIKRCCPMTSFVCHESHLQVIPFQVVDGCLIIGLRFVGGYETIIPAATSPMMPVRLSMHRMDVPPQVEETILEEVHGVRLLCQRLVAPVCSSLRRNNVVFVGSDRAGALAFVLATALASDFNPADLSVFAFVSNDPPVANSSFHVLSHMNRVNVVRLTLPSVFPTAGEIFTASHFVDQVCSTLRQVPLPLEPANRWRQMMCCCRCFGGIGGGSGPRRGVGTSRGGRKPRRGGASSICDVIHPGRLRPAATESVSIHMSDADDVPPFNDVQLCRMTVDEFVCGRSQFCFNIREACVHALAAARRIRAKTSR